MSELDRVIGHHAVLLVFKEALEFYIENSVPPKTVIVPLAYQKRVCDYLHVTLILGDTLSLSFQPAYDFAVEIIFADVPNFYAPG